MVFLGETPMENMGRLVDDDVFTVNFNVEKVFHTMGLCSHGYPDGECDDCPGGAMEDDEEEADYGFSIMN